MVDNNPTLTGSNWTVAQNWAEYSAAEHALWDRLFARQTAMLVNRACSAFLSGVDWLQLSRSGIPDFADLNGRLGEATGWQVVAVPGLVPDAIFFDCLANRRFPVARFLRTPDQIDYLQEPDVFHDVFGHVPMLADPVFADYMQAYGKGGLRSLGYGALHKLARLYWYTVEFGLIEEAGALRIFGAGIVSSFGESHFALESPVPNRIAFDLLRITLESDFGPLYAALETLSDLMPIDNVPEDRVISANPTVPR
jgi:phenylalanine-4-hydroxylase